MRCFVRPDRPVNRWAVVCFCLLPGMCFAGKAAADEDQLLAAGFRKLPGTHLTVFTDLPPSPGVDALPAVFDQAVPLWETFFGAAPGALGRWHVVACVMRDRQRFLDYGLLPETIPTFLHGMQAGNQVWVLEQPSDYYRRHLLLHEGTHAVMHQLFGSAGPAWYREGMAELLATHRWHDDHLELAYFPQRRDEVADWGRIKIIREAVAAGRPRSVLEITDLRSPDFLKVEAYAWCWGLTVFCDRYPPFHDNFRALRSSLLGRPAEVTQEFLRRLGERREEMETAWQLFLAHVDYGYDVAAEQVEYQSANVGLPPSGAVVEVDAARGWQSTGFILPPEKPIVITAVGRYQVGADPRPWWCEPQGVTIDYYQGQPLGILLGAVVDPTRPTVPTPLREPLAVGRRLELKTKQGGVLFLRINERSDGLRDNRGKARVTISPD